MPQTQDELLAAFQDALRSQRDGRLEEAAGLWAGVLAAAPASAEARANLGLCLMSLGRLAEAENELRRSVAERPDAPWAVRHLAALLAYAGRWSEAAGLLEHAVARAPEDPRLRLNLGYLRLGLGDFARGWPLYEARTALPDQNAAKPPLPGEWLGEDLNGRTILVWPEQGFGDQIQFARYVPALAERGAEVTLAAPGPLVRLFARLGQRVIEQTERTEVPVTDHWALIGSLAGRLGPMDFRPRPYLARTGRGASTSPPQRIGFAWRGRSTHPNDAERSLPSPALLDRLNSAGRTFVDLTEPVGDFADLAEVVEGLDLVVTVDTALAHLAGALGKPVFVLLPWWRQDWRWMQGRADSPWYPSARLFRQPRRGDWRAVLDEVAEALAR
ncbi:tetratricopeptide repeat protein [Phenylobacterium sp.]|uniref:tetratricopeptide repeat protein n=1 Tax=Phenylobacterium sp. TaxID=1871053 RepID=UPI0035AE94C9